MISIVRHLRFTQGPLHSCCRLIRTPNIPLTAFTCKQTPLYWSSTSKTINDPSMHQQGASSNSSKAQKNPKKSVFLSAEAQRAIWAWKVIQMIRDADDPTDIKDSLRSRLLAAHIDTTNLEFDLSDQFKNDILEFFTIGKEIDQSVYNQERIRKAMTERKNLKRRLIFYPTTQVSRFIFNIILKQSCIFMYGSFGIGKTISYVLYCQLAQYIHKLVFLAEGNWIPKDKQERYLAELELLKQKKLIQIPPKCWFWSIDRRLEDREASLIKKIKAQTKEYCLEGQYKKELKRTKKMDDLIQIIDDIKSQSIRYKIILDQVNILLSYIRKWNHAAKKYKQTKGSADARNELNDYKKKYLEPIDNAHYLIAQYKMLSPDYILNSSFQVQKSLLYPQSFGLEQHFHFINHGDPGFQSISYRTLLEEKKGAKIQYCQLFLVLLQQRLRQLGALPNNIENITQKFSSETIKVKSYQRFLYIREYLNQSKTQADQYLQKFGVRGTQLFFQILKTHQTDEQINEFLLKLDKHFRDFCFAKCKMLLEGYLTKPEGQEQKSRRRTIIHCIRLRAKALELKKQTKLIVNISDLEYDLKSFYEEKINVMKTFFQLSSNKNETLLPFKYDQENQVLEFEWQVSQFLVVSQDYDVLEVTKQDKEFLEIKQLDKQILLKNRFSLGNFVEGYIDRLIRQSSSFSLDIYQKATQTEHPKTFQMPKSEVYFWALNKEFKINKQKGVSIHHNLQALIKRAQKQPNNYFKGTPHLNKQISLKGDSVEFASTSQSVDFILLRYKQQQNLYEIFTFDVTINGTVSAINNKVTTAKTTLSRLLEFQRKPDQSNYVIRHIIICPKKMCQSQQVFSQELSIEFATIESLLFMNSKSPIIKKRFESLRIMALNK